MNEAQLEAAKDLIEAWDAESYDWQYDPWDGSTVIVSFSSEEFGSQEYRIFEDGTVDA